MSVNYQQGKGNPKAYRFDSLWQFEAPIEQVWQAICDSESWPKWWAYVVAVEGLEPGNTQSLGSLKRFHWRTQLPYQLVFEMRTTKIEAPNHLEGEAQGELIGTGRWFLSQDGAVTSVRYLWEVSTRKAWMNLLAPLLRPAFVWNHHQVMKQGARGLANYLGVSLINESSASKQPLEAYKLG
ncbi:MAG: SRPBCC family protein [Deinococcales bacterium]